MCTNIPVAQTRSFANARKDDVSTTLAHSQAHLSFARGHTALPIGPQKKGEHPKASALAGGIPGPPFAEV